MDIIVNGEYRKVSLRAWDEHNGRWAPDCFSDLEFNVQDGSTMTEDEYGKWVEFWQAEVDAYNAGRYSEVLGEPRESAIREFGFWYD